MSKKQSYGLIYSHKIGNPHHILLSMSSIKKENSKIKMLIIQTIYQALDKLIFIKILPSLYKSNSVGSMKGQ